MTVAIVTGSAGLVGSATARALAERGMAVVGIDNDLRRVFFGDAASTLANRDRLIVDLGASYTHHDIDIRDSASMRSLFRRYGCDIGVVVHAAAQPGHAEWSLGDPLEEFDINARATLGLAELIREWCPNATFLLCSTTKVYGDRPNQLPFVESATRFDLAPDHRFWGGVTEDFSVDQSLHTSMGMSKLAADVIVQEYGLHHGLRTAVFRNCNIVGSAHAASKSHGMLGYVMQCAATRTPFTVLGFGGKQVRDLLHVDDLVAAFLQVIERPSPDGPAVYNMGGSRFANCSLLEALQSAQEITGNEIELSFADERRVGDHIWWIASNARFQQHYPDWSPTYDVEAMMLEIYEAMP